MSLTNLKKMLNSSEHEELTQIIIDVYKSSTVAKEFLDIRSNSTTEHEVLQTYMEKVRKAFFGSKYTFDLKKAKKAVSDFKKLSSSPIAKVSIMFYYVEIGIELTNEIGDIDENYYYSLETVFEDALKTAKKEKVLNHFKNKAAKFVNDTSDIGWGFHDQLSSLFDNFFNSN